MRRRTEAFVGGSNNLNHCTAKYRINCEVVVTCNSKPAGLDSSSSLDGFGKGSFAKPFTITWACTVLCKTDAFSAQNTVIYLFPFIPYSG